MKKRFKKYFPPLFVFGELLVLTAIFMGSVFITNKGFISTNTYLFSYIVYLSIWPIVSYVGKDYNIGRAVSYFVTLKRAFRSVFIFVSIISLGWLFSNIEILDRQFLMTLVLLLFIGLSVYRISVHLILDKYRAFGGNVRYAVIVGYDALGKNLFDLLRRKSHYGIRCKGFYGDHDSNKKSTHPILGNYEDFSQTDLGEVDFIYVSERVPKSVMNKVVQIGDSSLKKIKLLPEFKTDELKTFVLRRYESIPIIDVNNLPLDTLLNKFVKRSFDIVFSLTIILGVLSWLYPILGILVKLESRGPVLFKQRRHGKDGSEFWCYKFRTMIINSEADTRWASPGDPRVTRIGAFLRRTSLDEFPQFLNVLLGSMSIVGPRPHPISLNEAYEDKVEKFAKRHASKPGVTGLAQAMGYRGEISEYHHMSSRVRLDRFYLQNWSFVLDIKIVLLTIISVLKNTERAY